MKKEVIIGTRGSQLALWQAEFIKSEIEREHKDVCCKLNIIKTKGDKILDVPLAKIGGKGLFVKEIEAALLDGSADIAVHSMKDVPMELPSGLTLFSTPKAEVSEDAFVSFKYNSISELPKNAVVGTSSLRRKLQLLEYRADLEIKDLRGNLQTRLKKLEDGEYDGIILAKAGLLRLKLDAHIKETISKDIILPATAQGILGIEIRENDDDMKALLAFLNDTESAIRASAERKFLRKLEGGCQVPIACHSVIDNDKFSIKGLIYNLDGSKKIERQLEGNITMADSLAEKLADDILQSGGKEILKEIYT